MLAMSVHLLLCHLIVTIEFNAVSAWALEPCTVKLHVQKAQEFLCWIFHDIIEYQDFACEMSWVSDDHFVKVQLG